MAVILIAFAVMLIWCIFLNKISTKIGVPSLLLFIIYGMISGQLDEEVYSYKELYSNTCDLCTIALIFIMFYGGFGTKWKTAKPVIVESSLLATLGVFLTAGLIGTYFHFVRGWDYPESILIGAVISSTDAASVFSILRTKNLGLKYNTAPMLEIESGSNDPCSYMLTIIMLSFLQGNVSGGQIVGMIVSQLVFGAGIGLAIAWIVIKILKRYRLPEGFDMMFFVGIALLSYALPSLEFINGNGYLSTYIVGIVLGNTEFRNRKGIVHFFDGTTSLAQICIFFYLGYICTPKDLISLDVLLPAISIFAVLTLIARPITVAAILLPFKKYREHMNQIGLISFVGLRGAASIVFAIMTLTIGKDIELGHDIFNIVFVIVLISILLQGSLIPYASKKFNMIDKNADVRHTFTDFSENSDISFGRIELEEDSKWVGKIIKELYLPKSMLISLIIRGKQHIVPKGHTQLQAGDKIIFSSKTYTNETENNIFEHQLSENSIWIGKRIKDYPYKDGAQVLMIKRGKETLIPNGETVLHKNDVLVILKDEYL